MCDPSQSPPTAPPPSLHSLPDAALHSILLSLLGVPSTPSCYAPLYLRGRSLERAADVAALVRASSRARRLLRRSAAALDVHWDDCVGAGVVGFFAPALRRLSVSRHVQAPRFVDALSERRPTLEVLKLVACPVDHGALAKAVKAMEGTLREFAMEYVSAAGGSAKAGATCAALAGCGRLERVSLHGAADLPHASLVRVLRECGRLRALSIGYLRHASIGPGTLAAIGECEALETLALHDTRWASPADVMRACVSLGEGLRCLSLDGVQKFSDAELGGVVAGCPRLVGLTVRCDEPGLVTAEGVVSAVAALSPNLRLLDVSGSVGVGDEEMSAIVAAAPGLRELRLRNATGCSNTAMFEIAGKLHRSLRVLDVTGTSLSDEGLAALGAARSLAALQIGTPAARRLPMAFMQPAAGGGAQRPAVISNVGVEELLRGCGRSLRRFSCQDLHAASPPLFGAGALQVFQNGGGSAGRPLLSGTGIFRSLMHHCSPRLEAVVMQKMTPPLSARVDRARMNLRMIELEEACPNCTVWIDRESPPLLPMTLEELLADAV